MMDTFYDILQDKWSIDQKTILSPSPVYTTAILEQPIRNDNSKSAVI